MNTTPNPPVGSIFFVRWYGKVVQVEVTVRPHADAELPAWNDFVAVLITVPGSDGNPLAPGSCNLALFHYRHLYDTPNEAMERVAMPDASPADSKLDFDTLLARYRQFKDDHWDCNHNHLQVSALEEFYGLWRTCIALKHGQQIPTTWENSLSANDSHKNVPSVTMSQQQPLAPLKYASGMPQPTHGIPKPTKKQLRSAGRIQYADTIQTSIFD